MRDRRGPCRRNRPPRQQHHRGALTTAPGGCLVAETTPSTMDAASSATVRRSSATVVRSGSSTASNRDGSGWATAVAEALGTSASGDPRSARSCSGGAVVLVAGARRRRGRPRRRPSLAAVVVRENCAESASKPASYVDGRVNRPGRTGVAVRCAPWVAPGRWSGPLEVVKRRLVRVRRAGRPTSFAAVHEPLVPRPTPRATVDETSAMRGCARRRLPVTVEGAVGPGSAGKVRCTGPCTRGRGRWPAARQRRH